MKTRVGPGTASPVGPRKGIFAVGLSGLLLFGPTGAAVHVLGPTSEVTTALGSTSEASHALGPTGDSGEAEGAQFWCPMHPNERSDKAGACALCGMTLIAMPAASFATYPVDFRVTPTTGGVRLRLGVKHPKTNATVRKMAIVHERPMHLFVVGEGLDFFAHEHPVAQPDGVFMLDLALPRAGAYMAIAEFLPDGGSPQTFQQMFTTGSGFGRPAAPAIDVQPKVVDGVRVSVDLTKVVSGDSKPLTFSLADAASGTPIADLEPYLGASGHLLLVPADLTEAIHGHPTPDLSAVSTDVAKGPTVSFAPLVPRPGLYKLWLQFQRAGRVSTVAFVVAIP